MKIKAEDGAGELTKGLAAVRAKAEEQDRDAVGDLKLAAVVGGYIMPQSQRGVKAAGWKKVCPCAAGPRF